MSARRFGIREGDALAELSKLKSASVQCIVTSPPYWGLRDYGVDGQIGLERTSRAYLQRMVGVFREARRVLRRDGTLWLNMGDSYVGGYQRGPIGKSTLEGGQASQEECRRAPAIKATGGELRAKNLVGMPWRVALALQADRWVLRQDIVWAKPNPMPESVGDRCTKAHEYVFILTRSSDYYFDADAIAEPRASTEGRKPIAGWAAGPVSHAAVDHARDKGDARTFRGGQYVAGNKFANSHATERTSTGNAPATSTTRNARSVWEIATEPCPEAHFATFPKKLVERCLLAGTKPGDVVLDPFAGSGTVGIVALAMEREFVGIELNPEYAAMARRRIKEHAPLFNRETVARATRRVVTGA